MHLLEPSKPARYSHPEFFGFMSRPPMSQSSPPFRRSAATWTAYGLFTLLTLQVTLVGPIMPYLRTEMGLSYAQGALHTSSFAIGMMASGFLASLLQNYISRKSIAIIACFALILCFGSLTIAPNIYVSVLATAVMGLVGSMVIPIGPMILAHVHRHDLDRALAEANLVGYLGGLIAPVAVAIAVYTVGWRGAALAGPILFALLFMTIRSAELPQNADTQTHKDGRLGLGYWAFWSLLSISVATEFCFMVWSASFLELVVKLSRETAVLGSTAFPIGMVLGRLAGIPILKHIGAHRLSIFSHFVTIIGFAVFFVPSTGAIAIFGLLIAGIGIGNLYPTAIAMALKAAGPALEKGSGHTPIAGGLAIVASPFILGALADNIGLYLAYLIVPLFIVCGLIAIRIGSRAS